MSDKVNLIIFGDQTVETYPSILELFAISKRSVFLRTFLQEATDSIQSRLTEVEPSERTRFDSLQTLVELAETDSKRDVKDAAVSSVLLSVVQLGFLIVRAENDSSLLQKLSNSLLLGLCTGMLAAAAAASVNCLGDLLKIATEVVGVSLRLGLEVDRRSAHIEHSTCSWVSIISDISVAETNNILLHFHEDHQTPRHRRAYISAEANSSVTISGPPTTLALLLATPAVSGFRITRLSISAAYHAEHLPCPDYDEIIGKSSLLDRGLESTASLLSTSSGTFFKAPTLRSMLRQTLHDIMQAPLRWPLVVQTLTSTLPPAETNLFLIGPCNATNSLCKSLRAASIDLVERQEVQPRASEKCEYRSGSGEIAIIGMSGRFPGGENLEAFWQTLEDGLDLHKKVPSDRFNVDTHCDPTGKKRNTTVTPYGCFLDHPGFFDARLFNMSPREAAQTDPMQRLLLMTTYEALEMAGYSHNSSPAYQSRRIGSFFGQTSDDWREVNASQDIDTYFITGGIRAFGPGRVNYHFGWEGPSYSLDTACSSSSASIQLACSALLARECDTAVAGGANVLTASDLFAGLSRGGFLSPSGGCKTFDSGADGYCRADAVGSIVLKRLEDAVADRDNIQAVIKSAMTNHSAGAVSITHPHAETQERLFRSVLRASGVKADEVEYVELHGTGTQAGDATESRSVTNVFARDVGRTKDNPLHIGTVKPNVGHGEAASGVTSVIKAVMMLQKNIIPPHVGIKGRMNEKLPPFESLNVRIALSKKPFKPCPLGNGRRKIMVNNFDAAGGNTSILIEDPPHASPSRDDHRQSHVVVVSARTSNSLKKNIENLTEFLRASPDRDTNKLLADLAYTTSARRMHHVFRRGYAVTAISDLITSCSEDLATFETPTRSDTPPSVVFTFTGQGSQYAAMGRRLFDTFSSFRKSLLASNDLCKENGLPSFLEIITETDYNFTTASPVQTQLALVSFELALARLWQSWGVKPTLVIGHSLGEYPALCVAGVLSVADMLYLVGKRAQLIEEHCIRTTHAMLAVRESVDCVQQKISDWKSSTCEIACVNGPNATVVSGTTEDIDALDGELRSSSIKTRVLRVPFAFHSSQLDPVLQEYEIAIGKGIPFRKPAIPIASTLHGDIVREQGTINGAYLAQQTRRPVQFLGAVQRCERENLINDRTIWIDLGPSPLCLGMVQTILKAPPTKLLPSITQDEDDLLTISKSLVKAYESGVDIMWNEYHREHRDGLHLLDLPLYAFDLKDFWIQYEGDWALNKGRSVLPPPSPSFSTTTLQKIVFESFSEDVASVTFSSSLMDPKLRAAINGHLVNDTGLCPSSVYADMAFTAASYVCSNSKLSPLTSNLAFDVRNMEVFKPLIADPKAKDQAILVSAVQRRSSDTVHITFSSQNATQSEEHAHCEVRYGDGQEWMSEWATNAYLIQARINHLIESSKTGMTDKILRKMIYKLFSVLVKYSDKYQGLKEAYMDDDLLEATAKVKFQATSAEGTFTYSPYWIDSIAHLSGFVLNASNATPDDAVYISHGWKSMRIVGSLSADKNYDSYVRMQPTDVRGVMAGDVYLFESDRVIAVCRGLKFQQVKRAVLHRLLPGNSTPVPVPVKTPCVSSNRAVGMSNAQRSMVAEQATEAKEGRLDTSVSRIMSSISLEIGVEAAELVDEAYVADLGVDSLLTVSILARLREETGLAFSSSLFADYPTVASLKSYFQMRMQENGSETVEVAYESSSEESSAGSTGATTPSGANEFVTRFKSILASEIGIEEMEIGPDDLFADLGVDSLLSLSILAAVKADIGVVLSSSFLQEHLTLGDVERTHNVSQASIEHGISNQIEHSTTRLVTFTATSVLLQGHPTSDPPLYLLPDGSGSAASYVNLPPLQLKGPVYGLNSPFCASPLSYTQPLETVALLFVSEIVRQHPHGPYLLGGWSVGGTYAFEVAKILISRGERVAALILIDAPCPKALPPLPIETIDVLEELGIFDGLSRNKSGISQAVRQHFLGSIAALKQYQPTPLGSSNEPPKCFAIWARQGVWESVGPEKRMKSVEERGFENDARDWLMDARKDFGPQGWEKLVPEVECAIVPGNHFTIMRQPDVRELGKVMRSLIKQLALAS